MVYFPAMNEHSQLAPERTRPLRRSEYDRLVELGAFEDERVELLRGVLFEMSPHGTRHAEAIRRLTRLLSAAIGSRALVQTQLPLALLDHSEPEPDLAVVPPGDYSAAHPTTALLVVEVGETSLRKDREVKAALYAEAGIPEYWLVDLATRAVEVRTEPRHGAYSRLETLTGGSLRPGAFPDVEVPVAPLLV
jgi:Uma2 family endonuclease